MARPHESCEATLQGEFDLFEKRIERVFQSQLVVEGSAESLEARGVYLATGQHFFSYRLRMDSPDNRLMNSHWAPSSGRV